MVNRDLATLEKALFLLEDGARWTRCLRDQPSCHCPYTALLGAHLVLYKTNRQMSCDPNGLRSLLLAGKFAKISELAEWNDHPDRKWEEVKILFENAIKLAGDVAPGPHLPGWTGEDGA
jgi:hypothetical protein